MKRILSILFSLVLVLSFSLVTAVPAAADDAVIDIAAIAGVTVPVTGATPVTTITATAQYTGTVTWAPAAGTFASATAYTAFITLTPATGYTLTGVTANFFTVAGATSATNAANSGVITAIFPATATTINSASVDGVTAPVVGSVPVTTITADAQYTGTVAWAPSVATTFLGSQVYTATITLTPTAGFTLTGVAENFFTVADSTSGTNPADSGVVTAAFVATAAATTEIDIAGILGVTAPVVGAVPVTAITEAAQYTGTVTWSPVAVNFAGEQIYTATITLTPKPGFTLTGVDADFFTVAGATATNAADSGVITAIFPATAAAVINIAAVPGVTVPVTGATPVTTITETAQYTGTVAWSPVAVNFAGEQIYTATITLTPKPGFTLTGVAENFFTVAGSATDTNPADSGVVTATFAATATTIAVAAVGGVTAPVTGAAPVATVTATDEYTGTVTWSPAVANFAGAQVYTAFITLTPKAGYTLVGVAANFFTVAGATSDTNAASSGVVTVVFPATVATVIDIAAIPGVTVPATGAVPVTTITETDQYTGTVTWAPVATTFAATTAYTATITLTAKAGFTLVGVAENFFTVAGSATDTNPADSGVVTATFAATAAVINIAVIPGVTAPVTGVAQDITITETAQYTGTIAWSPNDDPFVGTKVYTATITLTAKAGFTLAGVAANFYTVAGATATNPAGSGVITAVFPITYDKSITLNDGWTLVSTDKWVDATKSAWVDAVQILKYVDAATGYLDATFADLTPVEALYVQTSGGGFANLNYSDAQQTVSVKELTAGWNLVSSATVDDAAAIFSSLRYALIGGSQGVCMATLVSQDAYNLTTGALYLPALTDANWTTLAGTNLDPFDGYWIYLNAAKTFGVIPDGVT